ncbi:MAG: ornithine carbamoyltransferase [Clostridiaceae bacterium]|nr:ornithine carbamoyltransferase [Clostridiaceae bacterium]
MGYLLHFLDLNDLQPDELANMIRLAEILKNKRRRGSEEPLLAGKTLAMIFTKASTRTRVSFESGMFQLGGSAFFLSNRDIQMGRGETISDTAHVLSRLVDAVLIRTFSHAEPLELAVCGQVPVINGLTDLQHPTQIIADLLTIKEHLGRLRDFKLAWFGDTNNVANSLIQAAKLPGIEICLAVPEGSRCDERCWEQAQAWAEKSGSKLSYTSDPYEAARDAHVFYTDTWVSMGQEAEHEARVKRFADYQVNETLMALGSPEAIFLHCLPAYRGFEVSAEVIDGSQSVVFDQAENRLHAHKAILVSLLAPEAAGSLFHINNGDSAAHGKKYR